MAQHPDVSKFDVSSLNVIVSAGSVLSDGLRARIMERIPDVSIFTFYGMSESTAAVTSGIVDGSRPGSVGQVAPGTQVKIIDEDGNALENEKQGEVLVRRNIMFAGYYNSPTKTKEAFDSDGWYHSGDVGYFDKDGHLYIIDRIKDIILYNNFWIAPAPLEDKIQSLNGVHECAVVGIPDEIAVDLPAAVVVKSTNSNVTEADVAKIIADNYADAKKLRGGVYFVESLPMTPSGKIKRREVKKIATELYKKSQEQSQQKRQVSSA